MRACGSGNSPASNLMRATTTKLSRDPVSFPTEAMIIWFETGGCVWDGSVRGVMYAQAPDSDPDYANRTDLVTFTTAIEPIPSSCANGFASNLTFSLPSNQVDGPYTLQIEYTSVGPSPPPSPNSTSPLPGPSVTMIQCADVFVVTPRSSGVMDVPSRALVVGLGILAMVLSVMV